MRSFDSDFLSELEASTSKRAMLFTFDFPTPIYYTDHDIDIYYNSNNYESMDIKASEISYKTNMEVDSITIEVQNVDRNFSYYLLSSDKRKKYVYVYLVAFVNYTKYVEEIFTGEIDSWEMNETKATIRVASSWIRWNKKTFRNCSATCPWNFKSSKLVGYWNFDEGTGSTASDKSGHDMDLTLSNVSWDSTNKKVGSALTYSSNSAYGKTESTPKDLYDNTQELAVSVWVRVDSAHSGSHRNLVGFCENGGANKLWHLYIDANRYVLWKIFDNSYAITTSPDSLDVDTWYHLLCIFDGTASSSSRLKIYIDGSLKASGSTNYTNLPDSEAAGFNRFVFVGNVGTAITSAVWKGEIDELRIYRRVPNSTEISNLYNHLDFDQGGIYDGNCPYISATYSACDRYWSSCVDRGMEKNFGGFRWISYLEEKEIYWGGGSITPTYGSGSTMFGARSGG